MRYIQKRKWQHFCYICTCLYQTCIQETRKTVKGNEAKRKRKKKPRRKTDEHASADCIATWLCSCCNNVDPTLAFPHCKNFGSTIFCPLTFGFWRVTHMGKCQILYQNQNMSPTLACSHYNNIGPTCGQCWHSHIVTTWGPRTNPRWNNVGNPTWAQRYVWHWANVGPT